MKLESYLVKRIENNPESIRFFESAKQDTACKHVQEINRKIEAGEAELYRLQKNGEEIGFFAVEIIPPEFWLLGVVVKNNDNLFSRLLEMFEAEAKNRGCDYLMFSTVRPGLFERAVNSGFLVSQIHFRKKLS